MKILDASAANQQARGPKCLRAPLPFLCGLILLAGTATSPTVFAQRGPFPEVTVVAPESAAAETGRNPGTFVISRSGSATAALTVNVSFSGNAVNGTDYGPLPTSVTIAAGDPSATVTVTPIDDDAVENPETVILTVSPNADYTVGSPSRAAITIADNDVLFPVPFSVTPATGLSSKGVAGGPFIPNGRTYMLTNSRSAPLGWAATVNRPWASPSPTARWLRSAVPRSRPPSMQKPIDFHRARTPPRSVFSTPAPVPVVPAAR